jgi:hypothetical protein
MQIAWRRLLIYILEGEPFGDFILRRYKKWQDNIKRHPD